ncbi:MAG TPA: SRPBCC family protein [Vicinamibacterales bacterium]|nr:SRPBCC family protein [Vicinamibacterales bacterium]
MTHAPRSYEGKGTGVIASQGSDTRKALGGPRGIHVDASVTIGRPPSEVYRFWRDFENLPRFMRHLEQVSVREAGVSHWVARGPAGFNVEWDARVINDIDDKLIAWQSLDGSTISTAGSVHFSATEPGTTVRVRFQYAPPGGRVGAELARLFGEEPNQTVREDLERLKQVLERG